MQRMTRRTARTRWLSALVLLPMLLFAGCSFGVMFSKMLTGDPKLPAQFRTMPGGVDLTRGKDRIVIVCSVPAMVDEDLSTLNVDLIEGVTRRMKVNGIDVVSTDQVARWMDDNGGANIDADSIARHFDVDYVAWLDLQAFTLHEEGSPHLLRGRAQGYTRAFKVEQINGERTALSMYNVEFSTTYPPHQPVSEIGSPLLFQKDFIERVCNQLAEQFFDHVPGTDI